MGAKKSTQQNRPSRKANLSVQLEEQAKEFLVWRDAEDVVVEHEERVRGEQVGAEARLGERCGAGRGLELRYRTRRARHRTRRSGPRSRAICAHSYVHE